MFWTGFRSFSSSFSLILLASRSFISVRNSEKKKTSTRHESLASFEETDSAPKSDIFQETPKRRVLASKPPTSFSKKLRLHAALAEALLPSLHVLRFYSSYVEVVQKSFSVLQQLRRVRKLLSCEFSNLRSCFIVPDAAFKRLRAELRRRIELAELSWRTAVDESALRFKF